MTLNVLTRSQVSCEGSELTLEPGTQEVGSPVAELLLSAGTAETPKPVEAPRRSTKLQVAE